MSGRHRALTLAEADCETLGIPLSRLRTRLTHPPSDYQRRCGQRWTAYTARGAPNSIHQIDPLAHTPLQANILQRQVDQLDARSRLFGLLVCRSGESGGRVD